MSDQPQIEVASPLPAPPSVKDTIRWLLEVVRRPPLPECPQEAARTGKDPKQPAFISGRDRVGNPRVTTIAWKLWADPEVPVKEGEIRLWWADKATGIGTLGGWNGQHHICWVDIDLKGFHSTEECERQVTQWMECYPILKTAHRFRSQSGGYRFLVACEEKPEGFGANSRFALSLGGQPIGEVLCGSEGRLGHTLMPPTKGLKGDYIWEVWSPDYPVILKSIFEIGIHLVQVKPTRKPAPVKAQSDSDLDTALTCLQRLPIEFVETYESWLKVGMACHQISHEAGEPEVLLQPWIEWSQQSDKFVEGDCERKWRSFNASQSSTVGLGTLRQMAGMQQVAAGANRKESRRSRSDDSPDPDSAATLNELLALSQQDQPTVLPPELMHPLEVLAQRMGLPVGLYVMSLLAVAAAMLPSGVQLSMGWTGWNIPAILWLGLVGESGSAKSPVINALASPLSQLQREADEAYEEALAQYKQDLQEWENTPKEEREEDPPQEPQQEEFYLSDLTIEALVQVLQKQPGYGLPVISDELAALVNSQNSYRSGRGADRQHWLSLYDGKPVKVNRKGSPRIHVEHPRVSLMGSIQPMVLERMLSKDDSVEDGFWPRFTWVRVPLTEMPEIGSGPEINLLPLLTHLYRNLRALPPKTFHLNSAGIQLWNRWHRHSERLKVLEPAHLLRATLPKGRERAARLAIILHCIDAALAGTEPAEVIPTETLKKGIQLGHWLSGQTRQLFAEIGQDGSTPEVQRMLKFCNRFRGAGWIEAKRVRAWWPTKEKPGDTGAERLHEPLGLPRVCPGQRAIPKLTPVRDLPGMFVTSSLAG